MKIKNVGNSSSNIGQLNSLSKNVSSVEVTDFKNQLTSAKDADDKQSLVELSNNIIKQGELITKKCDIKELQKYKEMIANFFKGVVDSNLEFKKESKTSGGRRKIYANIKKANEDTDILAKELLKEQKDQVLILRTVDDIRGLILDTLL